MHLSPEREKVQSQRVSSDQKDISPERRKSQKLNISLGKESQKLNISSGKKSQKLNISPGKESQKLNISSGKESQKLNISPGKESQKLNISPVRKESQKLNISPGKESQKLDISPVRKEPQKMHTSYATAEVNGLSLQKETSKHKSLTMKDEEHKVKKSTEYILERNCNEKPPRKIKDNIKFPENGLRKSASLEKGKKQSNENVVQFILT